MKSVLIALFLLLTGCATQPPPQHANNCCSIFKQYPKWYWETQDVQKKWGVPISVQMAIMHQESKFKGDAKPPREYLLGFIPWFRPSSAYGYSQALDGTWKHYRTSTGNSDWFTDRDDFGDAADFIGWYASHIQKRTGISKQNAYALYLAYHEGSGGYLRKTYMKKTWLLHVAKRVQGRANLYRRQLVQCKNTLPTKPWWEFWV